MKKLSELKADGFVGTDMNIETSLYEYGLLCRKPKGAQNIQCWYGIGMEDEEYKTFDFTTISEKEIEEKINETWFNKSSFFAFLGTEERYWLCSGYVNQISDLIAYYGYQNIFGDCYNPVEIENDL